MPYGAYFQYLQTAGALAKRLDDSRRNASSPSVLLRQHVRDSDLAEDPGHRRPDVLVLRRRMTEDAVSDRSHTEARVRRAEEQRAYLRM